MTRKIRHTLEMVLPVRGAGDLHIHRDIDRGAALGQRLLTTVFTDDLDLTRIGAGNVITMLIILLQINGITGFRRARLRRGGWCASLKEGECNLNPPDGDKRKGTI